MMKMVTTNFFGILGNRDKGSSASEELCRKLLQMSLILLMFLEVPTHSFVLAPTKGSTTSRCDVAQCESLSLEQNIDNRPHDQRVKGPRVARRLNHGFRYLYRYESSQFHNMTSFEYLSRYYDEEDIYRMEKQFPPLLGLNVSRHLHPKMRFLHETMGVAKTSKTMKRIPPQYFGARLERIIAPRHAFLVYQNLTHGKALVEDPELWQDFLISCRTTKRFCALCNQWRKKQDNDTSYSKTLRHQQPITSKQIEAFDTIFGRGILAAARNEVCQSTNTWPLEHINISSAEVVELSLVHGANPLERDNRGSSLLHWAAGTGNLEAVKILLPYFPKGTMERTERDGATPLHWAAAGANSKEFGIGGHAEVCRYLLSRCGSPQTPQSNITTKELVNQLTKDGNSPLMWASWSGTLETVKMMVRNRADFQVENRNGCTVAHWAASGGNLEVCKYLGDIVGVDFSIPNYGGNTPLTHAVAFGHLDVVKWLRERSAGDDRVAAALAEDFYMWTDGEEKRKQVLKLFQDEYLSASDEDDDDGSSSISMNVAKELGLENY
jgi:ankyrin repeat protein